MTRATSEPAVMDPEANALRLVDAARKHPLDPIDRISEIIFGLVMVLTFTGTLRVAGGGREEVRELLVAALGCSVAWGIVDGVMYVLTSVLDRARRFAVISGIRSGSQAGARAILRAALPESIAAVTDEADVDRMVARTRALPAAPLHPGLTRDDVLGGLSCCVLTVLATLPPALPFLVVEDVRRALAISNAVTVASMFLAGWTLGRATGVRAWLLALGMVLLGGALVVVTIALGG
jgi:VIT1/CCC1 family predicted Fe2+/Mn2+ transporter